MRFSELYCIYGIELLPDNIKLNAGQICLRSWLNI